MWRRIRQGPDRQIGIDREPQHKQPRRRRRPPRGEEPPSLLRPHQVDDRRHHQRRQRVIPQADPDHPGRQIQPLILPRPAPAKHQQEDQRGEANVQRVDLGLGGDVPESRAEREAERADEPGEPAARDDAVHEVEQPDPHRAQQRGHEVHPKCHLADGNPAERMHDQHPRRIARRMAHPQVVGGRNQLARIPPPKGRPHRAKVSQQRNHKDRARDSNLLAPRARPTCSR